MRLRTAAPLILGSTLLVALISVACGGPDFNAIVQTTTVEQKLANVTATAKVLIAAGIDPTDRNVAIGKGSVAESVVQTQEVERLARAASGDIEGDLIELPNGEFVTIARATEIAEVGSPDQPNDAPAGPAASGEAAVDIMTTGKMVPSVLKITPGTTVTWTNTERTGHSSKADPGQDEDWDSESLARGPLDKEFKSFSHTFTIPGRYTYGSRVFGDFSLAVVFVVEE